MLSQFKKAGIFLLGAYYVISQVPFPLLIQQAHATDLKPIDVTINTKGIQQTTQSLFEMPTLACGEEREVKLMLTNLNSSSVSNISIEQKDPNQQVATHFLNVDKTKATFDGCLGTPTVTTVTDIGINSETFTYESNDYQQLDSISSIGIPENGTCTITLPIKSALTCTEQAYYDEHKDEKQIISFGTSETNSFTTKKYGKVESTTPLYTVKGVDNITMNGLTSKDFALSTTLTRGIEYDVFYNTSKGPAHQFNDISIQESFPLTVTREVTISASNNSNIFHETPVIVQLPDVFSSKDGSNAPVLVDHTLSDGCNGTVNNNMFNGTFDTKGKCVITSIYTIDGKGTYASEGGPLMINSGGKTYKVGMRTAYLFINQKKQPGIKLYERFAGNKGSKYIDFFLVSNTYSPDNAFFHEGNGFEKLALHNTYKPDGFTSVDKYVEGDIQIRQYDVLSNYYADLQHLILKDNLYYGAKDEEYNCDTYACGTIFENEIYKKVNTCGGEFVDTNNGHTIEIENGGNLPKGEMCKVSVPVSVPAIKKDVKFLLNNDEERLKYMLSEEKRAGIIYDEGDTAKFSNGPAYFMKLQKHPIKPGLEFAIFKERSRKNSDIRQGELTPFVLRAYNLSYNKNVETNNLSVKAQLNGLELPTDDMTEFMNKYIRVSSTNGEKSCSKNNIAISKEGNNVLSFAINTPLQRVKASEDMPKDNVGDTKEYMALDCHIEFDVYANNTTSQADIKLGYGAGTRVDNGVEYTPIYKNFSAPVKPLPEILHTITFDKPEIEAGEQNMANFTYSLPEGSNINLTDVSFTLPEIDGAEYLGYGTVLTSGGPHCSTAKVTKKGNKYYIGTFDLRKYANTCTFKLPVTAHMLGEKSVGVAKNNLLGIKKEKLPSTPTVASFNVVAGGPNISHYFEKQKLTLGDSTKLHTVIDNLSDVNFVGQPITMEIPINESLELSNLTTTCIGDPVIEGNKIIYKQGAVGAGTSCDIVVDVTPKQIGSYISTVPRKSLKFDGTTRSNTRMSTSSLWVADEKAKLTKTYIKENGEYTIMFKNTTDSVLDSVAITDTLPEGVKFVNGTAISIDSQASAEQLHVDNTNTVTFTAHNVLIGGEYRLKIQTSSKQKKEYTNTAKATYNDTVVTADAQAQYDGEGDEEEPEPEPELEPNVSITKTVDKTTAFDGEKLVYTITLQNTGEGKAKHIQFLDTLPQELENIAITNGKLDKNTLSNDECGARKSVQYAFEGVDEPVAIAENGIYIACNELAPNTTKTFTVEGTVKARTFNKGSATYDAQHKGNKVVNSIASVNGEEKFNKEAITYVQGKEAKLVTTKTVNKTEAFPGDDITYTITVENTSDTVIHNISLIESLPPEVTFTSVTVQGEPMNGYIQEENKWMINELSPNTTTTLILIATVNEGVAKDTHIINSISKPSINDAGVIVPADFDENSRYTATTVVKEKVVTPSAKKKMDIVVTKTVDKKNGKVNDEFTFTITAKNNTEYPVENVQITDLIPEGLSLKKATFPEGSTFGQGTHQWNIPLIPAQATKTLKIVVTTDTSSAGKTLTNTITHAEFTDERYEKIENYGANDDVEEAITIETEEIIQPVKQKVNIIATKTVDKVKGAEKDQFVFTITVHNASEHPINDITLTDTLPSELTFVSVNNEKAEHNNGLVTITIPILKANASEVIDIVVTPTITNWSENEIEKVIINTITQPEFADTRYEKAENYGEGNDLTESITVTKDTTVDPEPEPKPQVDITVNKTVNKTVVNEGENFTFVITVHNDTDHPINNVTVTDTLPTTLKVVNIGGQYAQYNEGIAKIVIPILNAEATETIEVTMTSQITDWNEGEKERIITNTASRAEFDDNRYVKKANYGENNELEATITIKKNIPKPTVVTNLITKKTVDMIAAKKGENITYTITTKNAGTMPLRNVKITDKLPEGLEFVSADSDTYNAETGIWSIDVVPLNTTKTLTIVAKVLESYQKDTITNKITNIVLGEDKTDTIAEGDVLEATTTIAKEEPKKLKPVITNKPTENGVLVITQEKEKGSDNTGNEVVTIKTTDEDGTIESYTLSGVNADNFEINKDGVITFKTNTQSGEYTFDIVVTDNDGLTATLPVKVIITEKDMTDNNNGGENGNDNGNDGGNNGNENGGENTGGNDNNENGGNGNGENNGNNGNNNGSNGNGNTNGNNNGGTDNAGNNGDDNGNGGTDNNNDKGENTGNSGNNNGGDTDNNGENSGTNNTGKDENTNGTGNTNTEVGTGNINNTGTDIKVIIVDPIKEIVIQTGSTIVKTNEQINNNKNVINTGNINNSVKQISAPAYIKPIDNINTNNTSETAISSHAKTGVKEWLIGIFVLLTLGGLTGYAKLHQKREEERKK